MADLMYNRMARRTKHALLALMAVLYLSVVVGVIYVIVHFVMKFW